MISVYTTFYENFQNIYTALWIFSLYLHIRLQQKSMPSFILEKSETKDLWLALLNIPKSEFTLFLTF